MAAPNAPAPGGRSKRLSADVRRAQILSAARSVFARAGLAGARVRDIAAEAGINEAMLYRHFPSKEELFEAAVAQPFTDAVGRLVDSVGTTPAEYSTTTELQRTQTRKFFFALTEVMEELAPLMGALMFTEKETARRYFTDRIQPTLRQMQALVETNYQSWPHRDFDPEAVVEWFFGMTWFSATVDGLTGRKVDLDARTDQMLTMFMDGLTLPAPPQ